MKRYIDGYDVNARMGFSPDKYHGTLILQVSWHDQYCELEVREMVRKNILKLDAVLAMIPKVLVWALNELGPNESKIVEGDIHLTFVYTDLDGGSYSMRIVCKEFSCLMYNRTKRKSYEDLIAVAMIPAAVEWISEKFGIGGIEANSTWVQ